MIFVSFSVDGMKKESKTSFNSLPIILWQGIPLNFEKAPFACMIVKDLFASTIILWKHESMLINDGKLIERPISFLSYLAEFIFMRASSKESLLASSDDPMH